MAFLVTLGRQRLEKGKYQKTNHGILPAPSTEMTHNQQDVDFWGKQNRVFPNSFPIKHRRAQAADKEEFEQNGGFGVQDFQAHISP